MIYNDNSVKQKKERLLVLVVVNMKRSINICDEPDNWPNNERETRLSRINDIVNRFIANPTYQNREIVVKSDYQLMQQNQS